MKPIVLDSHNELCANCGAEVKYTKGTGIMCHTANESYEEWITIKCGFCPNCGAKVEREEDDK